MLRFNKQGYISSLSILILHLPDTTIILLPIILTEILPLDLV